MIEQQRMPPGVGEANGDDPRTGNIVATGVGVATPRPQRASEPLQSFEYKTKSLKLVVRNLAQGLGLNVMSDDSFKDLEMLSVSPTAAP